MAARPMEYQVAALWIGGPLSYLEQLCLKSFVDAGQAIRLYHYDPVPNVPDGVELADAAQVLPLTGFLRHERTGSPALHSDVFRYHLLAGADRTIWADTDAYCVKPFTSRSGHFHAWESETGINGGVLGLPRDSATLAALLDFTRDEFAVPHWYDARYRADLERARDEGRAVHVSEQPWGVWGPHALTHFLKVTGEVRHTLPRAALYPFAYEDRRLMLRPGLDPAPYVTDETWSIHFYGRRMRARILAKEPGGVPHPRSVIGQLLRRHGIDPSDAPLTAKPADIAEEAGPAPRKPSRSGAPVGGAAPQASDAPELERAGLRDVATFADLCGHALPLALAAQARWDCRLVLVDLDRRGRGAAVESGWIGPYRDALIAGGVAPDRIEVVRSDEDLRPWDVVANLQAFGGGWKVAALERLIPACLHSGSVLITDIRKGSGAFPLLKARGAVETISTREVDGAEVTRALFRPTAAPEADPGWSGIARGLAGPDGFFDEGAEHSFLFVPRGDTLVVTFDNLDIAMTKREDRRPWGYQFIEKQGWSMLGVMANGWTWYRDPWVSDRFDRLRDEGFFAGFRRVVFYGASMGGYAACAFSAACPGAEVVAISPQSTLDRGLVPWETRYVTAWNRDFGGRYGDAAETSAAAARVTLLYDPYEPLDAGHVARFRAGNVVRLRTPLLGHRLGSSLHQMGILNPIILGALNGTLTEAEFYRTLRARRSFPRYQRELFKRAIEHGHDGLARRLGRWVLTRGDNRYIRLGLQAMDA